MGGFIGDIIGIDTPPPPAPPPVIEPPVIEGPTEEELAEMERREQREIDTEERQRKRRRSRGDTIVTTPRGVLTGDDTLGGAVPEGNRLNAQKRLLGQ